MAKFDYDFNLTPRGGKRHGDQWSRRMRLTVLFCIVAAVTAAVIYAIIPRKNIPPVKPPVPPVGAEQPSSAPEAPASAENPSAVQQTAEAAPQETEMPQATPGVPAEQPVTEEKPTETTATMPEKGQFSPSDPPSADDMPQRSGEKNPEMENRLNTLFHNGDYASFFAEADRMLAATAPDSEARAGIGGILTSGVKHLWQNGNWQYFATNYKVVPGDNLSTLARRKFTTVNLLKKVNNLKNANIMIGQQLKVVRGPWKVKIHKKARLMTVLRSVDNKETVFAVFSVGIGRKNSTPAGKFVICYRSYHPVYRDAQGRVFKYGHKNNPLGECFLALARPEAPAKPFRGYGIHGTADDASVGRSLSNGCVRMHNDDVTMLYYLLPAGTIVEITE